MDDLYRQAILEAYNDPQNQGELAHAHCHASGGNASCGDTISVQILLSEDKQSIADLKWLGQGCAISQATMSLLSDEIVAQEMAISDVQKLDQTYLLDIVGLDEINPGREKCLNLGLQTIQKAVSETNESHI